MKQARAGPAESCRGMQEKWHEHRPSREPRVQPMCHRHSRDRQQEVTTAKIVRRALMSADCSNCAGFGLPQTETVAAPLGPRGYPVTPAKMTRPPHSSWRGAVDLAARGTPNRRTRTRDSGALFRPRDGYHSTQSSVAGPPKSPNRSKRLRVDGGRTHNALERWVQVQSDYTPDHQCVGCVTKRDLLLQLALHYRRATAHERRTHSLAGNRFETCQAELVDLGRHICRRGIHRLQEQLTHDVDAESAPTTDVDEGVFRTARAVSDRYPDQHGGGG